LVNSGDCRKDLDFVEFLVASFTQRGTKMKKSMCIAMIMVALLLMSHPLVGHAGGPYYGGGPRIGPGGGPGWGPGWGGRWGGHWGGPGWGPGWGYWGGPRVYLGVPYGGGPYWGAPYPYYAVPPVVVQESPPVYVQPAPQPQEAYYWYYCENPKGYYPYVKECPKGWMKVTPSPPPSNQ
jgi:hypothetical protein